MALGSLGSNAREYVLKIVADVKDAVDGITEVARSASGFKDKAMGIGSSLVNALPVDKILAFGEESINLAAKADDSMDAVRSAFGSASGEIDRFSKTAAEKMGMSASDFQTMAAKTGQILTGLGVNQQDAAKLTETLSQRSADMAAIWGTSTEEAMSAVNSALMGQTRGLKKFGISLSKSEIDAKAMAMGYTDAQGKVTKAGRAIAAQQLILEQTSKYQGEFAKNSGDLGSQQEILKAKVENLQTALGEQLLPTILKVFDVVQPFINFLAEHADIFVPLAAGIMAIVGAVKAWQVAQVLLNSTLLSNPIFLVAAAIAALVAGIIWAYNNVEWFRNAVDAMASAVVAAFNWIKDVVTAVVGWIIDHWQLMLTILTGPIGAAVALIITYWDNIKAAAMSVFNWIKDNWKLLLAIITGPFGTAVYFITEYWQNIKDAVIGVWNWIRDNFGKVLDWIKKPFETAINWIKDNLGRLLDFIRSVPESINQALKNVANIIKYPFEQAINGIKWLWNNTIGKLSFTVPDWIPGIGGKGWSAPKLAAGGIVTKPTMALIGEAGPEAVIPLNSRNTAGLSAGVTLNVYALTANAEVGRLVYNALRDYERTSGSTLFTPVAAPRNF